MFSAGIVFLYATRFIAGMGIGGEYAAINSAIDESIPARYRGRIDIAVVGDDEVDDLAAGLAVDGPDVVGYGVIIRFPGLGHDVADIDLRRLAGADGLDDIGYAEIGHDARIEAARSEDDGVGFPDGVDGRLDGPGVFRRRKDALDLAVGMGNLRFPFDDAAVGHFGIEAELFRRRRDDLAADAQDLAGRVHGFLDVAQDFDEGGDEQVAEAVARQVAGPAEAVGEELFHEPFLIGQGDQAVAQVPWGDDIQVLADAACRTAIVGDGDEGDRIIGIYTDGDLRRSLASGCNFSTARVADVMSRGPKTIHPEALAVEAAEMMERLRISQLLVADREGRLVGALNHHDLMLAKVI